MGLINVNPDAELRPDFETVKPGTYTMRIRDVEDRNPEKNDLHITLEFVDPPMNLLNLSGQPCKAVGIIHDYIMLDPDKQWKLRQLTEATGLPWTDYDPIAELPGKELQVVIKLEPYEGEQRNKVSRYVIPKE